MPIINQDVQIGARIKVIGIGGSGLNAISHMIRNNVRGVEFVGMNTDSQDLHESPADIKIALGKNLTQGLGSGMNPNIGRESAEETKSEIQEVLKGAQMIFIACGMGGGTGTGASPIVAREAKDAGVLTIAVVTKPFHFEGDERMQIAEKGIEELRKEVDAIIVIPNQQLLSITDKNTTSREAFAVSDEVLRSAVEGIAEIIRTPGKINIDYADIKTILKDAGSSFMGTGIASGDNRAEEAASAAINSPLLNMQINGARRVLICIFGGEDLKIHEIETAAQIVKELVDPRAKVIFGNIEDPTLKNEMRVTIIATDFDNGTQLHSQNFRQEKETSLNSSRTNQNSNMNQNSQRSIPVQQKSNDYETRTADFSELEKNDQTQENQTTLSSGPSVTRNDDWNKPAWLRRNSSNQ